MKEEDVLVMDWAFWVEHLCARYLAATLSGDSQASQIQSGPVLYCRDILLGRACGHY